MAKGRPPVAAGRGDFFLLYLSATFSIFRQDTRFLDSRDLARMAAASGICAEYFGLPGGDLSFFYFLRKALSSESGVN